jgi:hypothetical protein
MGILALRAAFQTNKMTEPATDHARPLAELVAETTDHVLPLRVKYDYAGVGATLPDAVDELHVHIASPQDEPARRLALETLIEAYVSATDMANALRYSAVLADQATHDTPTLDPGSDVDGVAGLAQRGSCCRPWCGRWPL